MILYHFEVLHPLTYRYLIKYLLSLKDINTILLSTNATYLLDIHEKDCEKYIQLNNGFIVTVKDFVQLVKGKEEILTPIVYDVERMYRGYCSGKFPDVDTVVVNRIEKLNKERNDLDSEDYQ